jgi:hypothetical protein
VIIVSVGRTSTPNEPERAPGKLASGSDPLPSLWGVNDSERQHPRFAHEVAIRVRFANGGGKAKASVGRTRNVSRGGLCANVGDAIAAGTDVLVDVVLVFDDGMQSEALTLPSRIAWCTTLDDEFQIGVSFKPLDAERAQRIALFLKYLGEERAPKAPRVEKSIDDQFR